MSQVDNWAVCGWVNWLGGAPSARKVLFANGKDDNGYAVSVETSGQVAVYLPGVNFLASGFVPAAGTWFHVAALRNAGTSHVFVNGAQAGLGILSTPNAPSAWSSLGGITNGVQGLDTNTAANCRLADVAFYTTALTADELTALARGRRPKGVRPGSLFLYLPLFGLQSPEPDLSGGGHSAVLTGTAQVNGAPTTLFTRRAVNVEVILPQAPTNVTATPGARSVALSWSGTTPPPVTYSVYRSTTPGAETLFDNGIGPAMYTDGGVTPGATYYYQITATDPGGEGPRGAEVSATIPPPPPVTNPGRLWVEAPR